MVLKSKIKELCNKIRVVDLVIVSLFFVIVGILVIANMRTCAESFNIEYTSKGIQATAKYKARFFESCSVDELYNQKLIDDYVEQTRIKIDEDAALKNIVIGELK